MEPAEDTSLEAAIRWLVDTILGVLLMDKLDAWVRGVKLDDVVEKLKSEVERADSLVHDVRGRADGNRSLARSLARLKQLLYDADDVVDELDYFRLQHQVQGVTRDQSEGMHGAERVDEIEMASGDDADRPKKSRSLVWNHFTVTEEDNGKPAKAKCNYCLQEYSCKSVKNGTSNMRTHMQKKHTQTWEAEAKAEAERARTKEPAVHRPNPSSTADSPRNATRVEVGSTSNRKRKRANEEPGQTTAASTHTPWDKEELSNRIKSITSQLQGILEDLSKLLERHGSGCASSSTHHLSTILDQKLGTSSLIPGEVYGRSAEKDFIIKLITQDQPHLVTVLPIVGTAGVGKTALAQFVYNHQQVETQFQHRIWLWVSRNFDEVRLTRIMLEFISGERHEGISTFVRLQEILKTHAKSKRLLLIFDDVWDNMENCRWDRLLAPFISGQGNRIVVLITTGNLSVARRLGTLKPVKLGALENEDFWSFFKSHAFGDGNYDYPINLITIGRKIVENLNGNPLAAVSVGALLKEHLTVDHWVNIFQKEEWKSLGLAAGIMPALKLNYDQLPYHLQQCFSYCSIFPSKHKFLGKDLVRIWISQGFVKNTGLTGSLEETGWEYLTELVNLGFFQQVEQEEFSPDSQIWYSECGLMHDFARMVSRNECATIDGLQCKKMLPSIHHLSIVTDSAYNSKDQGGNIPRNEKFEEILRNAVTSVSKLRTLVLLGHYDSFFLQVLQDILQKAKNLRLLQMSATCAHFNSLMFSLADPTHLRYLKRKSSELHQDLPHVWSKMYHLQVLDIGSYGDGINNLVSLRHLFINKEECSNIASIGNMTSLQELHMFNVQALSNGFEMAQLESMNDLVELGLCGLSSVKTNEEACGARLGDKVHLERLHLSWNGYLSDEEYASDESSEEYASDESSEELPTDDGGPSSEPYMDAEGEVLKGLEPHENLKHLQISWYSGTTSPPWLANNISVTSLQTLHLDDCGGCRLLPSLERLPFLRKLELRRMQKVTEIVVPSLEELVLTKMPKLEICSSTSVEHLSCSLRVLQINNCHALKKFDLFESNSESESRQRSWLPGLTKLILWDCPDLEVSRPLPPSTTVSELRIERVSTLPYMKGSSSEVLYIGSPDGYDGEEDFDEFSDELRMLDDKILAFHNLRNLKSMRIKGCLNLTCISLKGISHLVSLKSLEISMCRQLVSLDVMPEHTLEDEDGSAANGKAFPSLESLSIASCGISGKCLSLLLKHAPYLEELNLNEVEDEENGQPKHGDALTGLDQDRLVHFPPNLISSLKKISIHDCPDPTFDLSEEGFSVFTSLQELKIVQCPELFSSLVHEDGNDDRANGRCLLPTSLEEFVIDENYDVKTLPCFPSDITSLRKLDVRSCTALESLRLQCLTALEELKIWKCRSLTAIEGLQSLVSLRKLDVQNSPGLESLQVHSCTALEELEIDICKSLTTLEGPQSLKKLEVRGCPALESLQLPMCVALEELIIYHCESLTTLEGLQSLLKKLNVVSCPALESLQLPSMCVALEELIIFDCESLTTLEGLQFLGSLRYLALLKCPGLPPWLESFSRQGYELWPRLDTLGTNAPSLFTTSFCKGRTSLWRLKLRSLLLSEEQGGALVLIKSLQELEFYDCPDLVVLPAGLHLLPSLKKLKIEDCLEISRLPERGLPPSLKVLQIESCSEELADECRALATSKLDVEISYCSYLLITGRHVT